MSRLAVSGDAPRCPGGLCGRYIKTRADEKLLISWRIQQSVRSRLSGSDDCLPPETSVRTRSPGTLLDDDESEGLALGAVAGVVPYRRRARNARLEEDPGFVYDKPWIGTARDTAESEFVYVTATRFRQFATGLPPNAIAFAKSADRGISWSSPTILDSGVDAAPGTSASVVQGSRPTGGSDVEVQVAWYHSGSDGFLNGQFQIRTRRSPDNGATWDPLVVAASELYELRFWLGPFDFYRRWWPAMMPDVEIAPGGGAHIAYTYSPLNLNLAANVGSNEQGDIRDITSGGPPYDDWSAPITVNDDGPGRAQGFAALNLQPGGASMLHLVWEDTRLAPNLPTSTPAACFGSAQNCDSPNLFYDVFYARRGPGKATGLSENVRFSDVLAIQDFVFAGDYIDLAVNDRLVYAIWTDRRDQGTFNGPGVTNNIQAPNIEGTSAGVLRLEFDKPTRRFGFGVAQSSGFAPDGSRQSVRARHRRAPRGVGAERDARSDVCRRPVRVRRSSRDRSDDPVQQCDSIRRRQRDVQLSGTVARHRGRESEGKRQEANTELFAFCVPARGCPVSSMSTPFGRDARRVACQP